MFLKSMAIAAIISISTISMAQPTAPGESLSADAQVDNSNAPPGVWPHPELSSDSGWAKEVVLVILLGFFLPAAIVGPLIRRRVAAELPELHDQEEESAFTASQHEPGHTRLPITVKEARK